MNVRGVSDKFRTAIEKIDSVNAEDPNTVTINGIERPKELVHSELMTAWIELLCPEASEALHLAARAHHVKRWAWPRTDYPNDRAGYLKWRKTLYDQHFALTKQLLVEAGYDEAVIDRVDEIMHKRSIRSNPEVQAYEDALCLVFMETQLHDLAASIKRDKMVEIVYKTLKKMSVRGRELAMGLNWNPDDLTIVNDALGRLSDERAK